MQQLRFYSPQWLYSCIRSQRFPQLSLHCRECLYNFSLSFCFLVYRYLIFWLMRKWIAALCVFWHCWLLPLIRILIYCISGWVVFVCKFCYTKWPHSSYTASFWKGSVNRYLDSTPGVKRPECGVVHAPPPESRFKISVAISPFSGDRAAV